MTYNFSTKEIVIPNYEISEHLASTIKIMDWSEVAKSLKCSEELLEATLNYDAEKVAWILEQCHSDNTSILQYNDENSLVYVISIAYYSVCNKYIMHRELASGKGFADITLIPRRNVDLPAIVVELKYNKTSGAAIEQIKNKNYTDKISEYTGDILLVGINYDDEKGHTCEIEEIVKQ